MRLLMICPSRSRPDRILDMLDSFDKTKSEGTEIIIYISEDDPCLEDYIKVLKGRNFIIGIRRSIVETYNYISCELHPDIPYYGMIDDDHYFITPGWDNRYIDAIEKGGGWGLACGEDKLTDWNKFKHPSGCIIDGRVIQTLGYFVYPEIKHIGTDMYLGALFGALGRLYHLPDVIIEHRHRINNMARDDDNYRQVYAKESEGPGRATFDLWVISQMQNEVDKINETINNLPKPQ
jgi:hypothetical protein